MANETRLTWTQKVEQYLRDWPDVSGGKGGHSASEQQAADQIRTQQLQLAQKQLGLQQQQISSVNSILDPLIAQGGMSPEQQAAQTSLLLNTLPEQFRGVQGQVAQQLAARGISGGQFGAGSGDIARQFGQLGAMEAGLQQQGLSQIQNQKAQQLFQALGAKMGVAGLYGQNTGLFNQGGLSALGQGVTAANNVDQAQSSWMGPVFGAIGSIGGGFAGGLGSAMGKGGCWIARAVYGDSDMRWYIFRDKLHNHAETSYPVRVLLGLYIMAGEPVAWLVKRSRILKYAFRRLFDWYLYA